MRSDVAQAQMDLRILPDVEENAERSADKLTAQGRHRSACDLKPREAEQTENHDRVEDHVDRGAGDLRDHGKAGAPGGLEQALHAHLHENAERQPQTDADIVRTVGNDLRIFRLEAEKGPCQSQAQQRKERGAAEKEKNAGIGGPIGGFLIFLTQRAGEQRIHADARSAGKGNAQVLQRKRKGHGVERVLRELGDKVAVHNIVKRLKEHGEHHRPGHGEKKLPDGHRAHFVFSEIVFHKHTH